MPLKNPNQRESKPMEWLQGQLWAGPGRDPGSETHLIGTSPVSIRRSLVVLHFLCRV